MLIIVRTEFFSLPNTGEKSLRGFIRLAVRERVDFSKGCNKMGVVLRVRSLTPKVGLETGNLAFTFFPNSE